MASCKIGDPFLYLIFRGLGSWLHQWTEKGVGGSDDQNECERLGGVYGEVRCGNSKGGQHSGWQHAGATFIFEPQCSKRSSCLACKKADLWLAWRASRCKWRVVGMSHIWLALVNAASEMARARWRVLRRRSPRVAVVVIPHAP